MRVLVPPDVSDGDEILVTGPDNREYAVLVPPGACAGEEIDVALPLLTCSRPITVTVTIPELCAAGDDFSIIYEDVEFTITVPEGMLAGDALDVEVPSDLLDVAAPPLDAACKQAGGEDAPPVKQAGVEDAPPVTRFSTFSVGLDVEVLRSNGGWTRGRVDATDACSGTFTIRMEDGRLKYLVEEADLRHFRAGAFNTGDNVRVRRPSSTGGAADEAATQPTGGDSDTAFAQAAIASYDDESDTYTLLLADGRKQYFVESDEILTGKQAAR